MINDKLELIIWWQAVISKSNMTEWQQNLQSNKS